MADRPKRRGSSGRGKASEERAPDVPASSANADSDTTESRHFDPRRLDASIIALPLLKAIKEDPPKRRLVIIDLNLAYAEGTEAASKRVRDMIGGIRKGASRPDSPPVLKASGNGQYLYAELTGPELFELVAEDAGEHGGGGRASKTATREAPPGTASRTSIERVAVDTPRAHRAIYHIWPDFPVRALINRSVSTVKADAARASFSASGDGVTWAVMDSGVFENHKHFTLHKNLGVPDDWHRDFLGTEESEAGEAKRSVRNELLDPFGHGTHVAGIIAGEYPFPPANGGERPSVNAVIREKRESEQSDRAVSIPITAISGMAPKCKVVSLRVLDSEGNGSASAMIEAVHHIQEINKYGRFLQIHGVNMSVGYDFDPEWFACGQSPLCVEVNRLVQSGVVVVVAAGNSGYGVLNTKYRAELTAGLSLTINDPGNADLAITVGSTHRDSPHTYGVSYFSSKGPTGDGRLKPDLVAPGEKIISCAAGTKKDAPPGDNPDDYPYVESSGTSMAAPHVSGVIAAFLSIRKEYIGKPQEVKDIFMRAATDLKRERYFQGSGLVDLMRAIQSV
jgi:serine protease AprX